MEDQVLQVFEHWKLTMKHVRAKLDQKRRRLIASRLRDGYTVEDLTLAIEGCKRSGFHQGQNDRYAVFDDIALICRDAEHVDRFIAIAEKAKGRLQSQAKQTEELRIVRQPATAIPDNLRKFVRKIT